MTTLTISEARASLPQVLDRVEGGDEVTITRHGRVVAVITRPEALAARRASKALAEADVIADLLTEARARPLPTPGLSVDRAEELIAAIRAGRDQG